MPSLDKRITSIEQTMEGHLVELGKIRADLEWLKKSVYFIMSSPLLVEAFHHLHFLGK